MNGEIRRIVLKIGSTSLNQPAGGLDEAAIVKIVGIIADLHQQGIECVLVSSGAVAAGMGQLQLQSDRAVFPPSKPWQRWDKVC